MEKQTPEPSHGDFVTPLSSRCPIVSLGSCHGSHGHLYTYRDEATHSAKDTHGKLTLNSGIGNSHWESPTSQQLVFNIPNGLSFLLLN